MNGPREERLAALAGAMRAWLEREESSTPGTDDEFLERHPECRDRLELALQGQRSENGTGEDGEPRRIGDYLLVRRLGRGGQGEVWLAEDVKLRRKVALKLLRPGSIGSPEALRRFVREAELASRLDHPGLCTVYDSGVADEVPYIAMRYVPGESLARRIERGAPPRAEMDAVAGLIEAAARALHAAHEAGIVHRDLKPGNLLIGEDGRPVLVDFGLARPDESGVTLTRTGDRLGTPAYTPPEQIALGPDAVDRRSDVYSLGVTLFEALTGRRPYDGATAQALEGAILSGRAPDPRSWNGEVPRDLAVIAATAMERDPARRYRSAEELAEDLRRFRERRPIQARPAGPLLRLRRWAQRSPLLATALSTLFLTLSAGLLVSLRLLGEARREKQAKEEESRDHERTASALLGTMERIAGRVWGRKTLSSGSVVRDIQVALEDVIKMAPPRIEMDLHRTLGRLWSRVYDHDRTVHHWTRAMEVARELHGPDHPVFADCAVELADGLVHANRLQEGEERAREALVIARRAAGDRSPVALRARLILAHGLEAQGRVAEADAVYREAAGSGDGPAEELHARQFHATWLMAQGRREEARQVLEQGIALATGQRDLNIDARMRQLLGEVHFQEGRMREAEDCLSKVVEYRLKWNSADHKRSTLALRWHGRALHNLGRYTEAVGPFEKVVAADWVEPQDRFWLGASLLALGRDEEGRDQILLAVSKGRATTPGQRPWDEAAGRAVEALRAGGFRFDATLAERLGDLKWLAGPVPSEAVTTDDER